jgi:hypothetical protein
MVSTVILAASETAEHAGEHNVLMHWTIGGVTLLLLLALLGILMAFGAGREHS